MELTDTLQISESPTEALAPWWHTLLVLMLLAAGSVASAYENGLPNAHLPEMSSRLSGYFTVIAEEWLLFFLIWLALKSRGISVGNLVSGRWPTFRSFFKDLGLAVGFLAVMLVLLSIIPFVLGARHNANLATIVPKTWLELLIWLAMSASGAFCEEFAFRGYFTRQFRAWTGSAAFAIVLQGIVFGLSHGYYYKLMVVIMVHGCLLGCFAHWRMSLLPGMLAHGLQDALGGVLAFFS
jgi:membrane protease YdiL (CAAX protease family)